MRALEEWVGVDLVDRSSYPVSLTRAGDQFLRTAEDTVRRLYLGRAESRARGRGQGAPVVITAQHAVARNFFPRWMKDISLRTGIGSVRLKSDDLSACIEDLVENRVDFILCFDHPELGNFIDPRRFPNQLVGVEWAVPVSAPDADGEPIFRLPGTREAPLPMLTFGPDAPVGWNFERRTEHLDRDFYVKPVFECAVGEVLLEYVLDGRGLCFLPQRLALKEIALGNLAYAGDESWYTRVEIRLYRALAPGRTQVEAIWKAARAMRPEAAE
ncbi:MAG: LysR family transcriptional regulator [Hyphomicrobiales bacterium]|nr:LysR family transcriptional regulator [Hyphomicrobiales bacterium]